MPFLFHPLMAGSKLALLAGAVFSVYCILLLTDKPCRFCFSVSRHNSYAEFFDNSSSKLLIKSSDWKLEVLDEDSDEAELKSNSIALRSSFEDCPHTLGHETGLAHIVFGIAGSAKYWDIRKEYVRIWWRPGAMRGFVWLDEPVSNWSNAFPPMKVSEDTSHFKYSHKNGKRSAIRISRIVSETFRLGLPDVHWFVMGDEDTVFVPENLVRVLSKYDHNKFFYIGQNSESHTQNIRFSYNMAYGGGGFAISYPLAKALQKMQDGCIQRYPYLYGSDDRMQACMAELGVQLSKEPGFHQFDVYGDAFGLLAAHPLTPFVSIHHLDLIDPIFPTMNRVESLQHLKKAMSTDPQGVLQQTICYDRSRRWSVSISWGYVVQIYRGLISPRDLELPTRTFLNWYRKTEESGLPFSSREVSKNPCEQPYLFFLDDVEFKDIFSTVSTYTKYMVNRTGCRFKGPSPAALDMIQVERELTEESWHLNPRRLCCRISTVSGRTMQITAGTCKSEEFIV